MLTPPSSVPDLPDRILRVSFAGNRELPSAIRPLEQALEEVFAVLARSLAEISPGVSVDGNGPRKDYYSSTTPTLRLITGLAEGADALAAKTVMRLPGKEVNPEHAAVLPFDVKTYRSSRCPDFLTDFDELLPKCTYVVTLDGQYEEGDTGRARRTRAYRAQATLLLRQADLLLVALNPEQKARSGGTLETIHAALAFDLPVIYVNSVTGSVKFLKPGMNVFTALDGDLEATDESSWEQDLNRWVTSIVANPSVLSYPLPDGAGPSHGEMLLKEFFTAEKLPPFHFGLDNRIERSKSNREKLWARVERWFRPPGKSSSESSPPHSPYASYQRRASLLNYHFSGLYRGTFLLNYVLAVVAVTLAALSLVLLAGSHEKLTSAYDRMPHSQPAKLAEEAPNHPAPHSSPNSPVFLALAFLGSFKLIIVSFIYRNTRQANRGDWNNRAVDYRYLAERLRTLSFLTRVGSFEPPSAAPSHYASRAIRQSAVDWLFRAIVRTVSPVGLTLPLNIDFGGRIHEVKVIQIDASAALRETREHWLNGQIAYHDRNAITMGNLHKLGERWGKRLSFVVIIAVALDIIILLMSLLFPTWWQGELHSATPWLMFLAAILPAAVASLNGIRFQSECHRLSDRSAIISTILTKRTEESEVLQAQIEGAIAESYRNPGSWAVEVLRLDEGIAGDLVKEVAEWSVLYAKDLVEL